MLKINQHKTLEKILKYFLIIILIFFTTMVVINKANSKVLGSTTIEGVLIDDVTKQPINDAIITAGGQTVKSDANGRYVISGLLSGKIIVEAKKDGYELFCESINVNKGVNSFNIQLKPNNNIQKDGVIICNKPQLNNQNFKNKIQNNEIINNITVAPKFSSYIFAQVIDIVKNIPISRAKVEIDGEVYFSDANGELISKPIKKSEILVKVEAISYQSYESNIKIKSGKNNVRIYLMPLSKETPMYTGISQNKVTEYTNFKQHYATLSGYVRDFKTKAPIANATVIVGTKSTQTNYQGFYSIEGLSMGNTSITVIAGNYGVYKGNVDINKITNINDISLVFEEKLSTITGTVVEKETGKPIYGAQIKLGNKITLSDEYGSFKISDVPYDYYNLIVEQKGYQKVEKAISVNQEKITVVVELADEFVSYKN